MGNQQLVRMISDMGVTDISSKEVYFQDGMLRAMSTFQRHNYQLYQVCCTANDNPLGIDPSIPLTLRVIRCMNDEESIDILREMQAKVINIKPHKHLIRFYVMALIQEDFRKEQRAGFIGLPGLYKSVAGTTDYKTDTIQFLLVEEDHLTQLPPNFFGGPQSRDMVLRQKFTLKQFLDRILPSQVLVELFSGDETILYSLIIQILEGLAYLNSMPIDPNNPDSNGCNHQDLLPSNIILEFVPVEQNPDEPELPQSSNDFHRKFNVRLSEYLNIKILSDIAFQKSNLLMTETKMARLNGQRTDVSQIIQQLREDKNLYSQYDPPEKLEINSIQLREGVSQKDLQEHFSADDFEIKGAKVSNLNSDIWSLGIIILEIYLSLYVHKRDCRDMVHNLYLNKMTYQSRCIIINEILDCKKNPIFCSLIKEMLRDSDPPAPAELQGKQHLQIYDEMNLYEDLVLHNFSQGSKKGALQARPSLPRPTAEKLLSFNRILHYFSFICDKPLPDKYLPSNINLLEVFQSNDMFVPLLIQCGMQNILNKNKALIAFFSLMTLVIRKREESLQQDTEEDDLESVERIDEDDSVDDCPRAESLESEPRKSTIRKDKVTSLVVHNLIQTRGYVQVIELLNFAFNSDLKQVMVYLNQKIGVSAFKERPGETELERLERLEQEDPMDLRNLFIGQCQKQKVMGLQLLIEILSKIEYEQRKRLRKSKKKRSDSEQSIGLQVVMQDYINSGLVPLMVLLIQKIKSQRWMLSKNLKDLSAEDADDEITSATLKIIQIYALNTFSKTLVAFVEKVNFFEDLAEIIAQRLTESRANKNRSFHEKLDLDANQDFKQMKERRFSHKHNRDDIREGAASQLEEMKVAEVNSEDKSKKLSWKIKFREKLLKFITVCSPSLSEGQLTAIISTMLKPEDDESSEEIIQFLSSQQMQQVSQTCSVEFKKFIVEILLKKFLSLHLKSSKQLVKKSPRAILNMSKDLGAKSRKTPVGRPRQAYIEDDLIEDAAKTANTGVVESEFLFKNARRSTDTLLNTIASLLTRFIDFSGHQKKQKLLQHCINNQICLSFFHAQFISQPLSPLLSDTKQPDDEAKPTKRRPASTISPNRHSTYLEQKNQTLKGINSVEFKSSHPSDQGSVLQFLSQYFFECSECSDGSQLFCLVCALKFHQGHSQVRQVVLSTAETSCAVPMCHYVQLQHEARELEKQHDVLCTAENSLFSKINYTNQTFLWQYEIDSSQVYSSFKSCLSQFMPKQQEPLKPIVTSSGTLHQSRTSQTLKQISSGTSYASQSKQPPLPELHTVINFDLFDRESVFTEKNNTHFISNDFDQHTLISSCPLAQPMRRERLQPPKDPIEFVRTFRQSYYEIHIHSGGFYDQIQVGLLFMQSDQDQMQSGSSSILNSFKNQGVIPGYEPYSIGYHGDDGKVFYNLSRSVALEGLISLAQRDPAKLLEEAETDSTLFDISNSVIYGGMYGPTFSTGDRVGCGVTSCEDGQLAVYFTKNGLRLPGVKLIQNKHHRFFPIISMKGKLCHVEVIKEVRNFSFNKSASQEDLSIKLLSWVKHNDKFMRSLGQFNQIQSLKKTGHVLPPSSVKSKRKEAESRSRSHHQRDLVDNLGSADAYSTGDANETKLQVEPKSAASKLLSALSIDLKALKEQSAAKPQTQRKTLQKSQTTLNVKQEGSMAHRQSMDVSDFYQSSSNLQTIPQFSENKHPSQLPECAPEQGSMPSLLLPPPAPGSMSSSRQQPGKQKISNVHGSTFLKQKQLSKRNSGTELAQSQFQKYKIPSIGQSYNPMGQAPKPKKKLSTAASSTPKNSQPNYQQSKMNVQQQSKLFYESLQTAHVAPFPKANSSTGKAKHQYPKNQ